MCVSKTAISTWPKKKQTFPAWIVTITLAVLVSYSSDTELNPTTGQCKSSIIWATPSNIHIHGARFCFDFSFLSPLPSLMQNNKHDSAYIFTHIPDSDMDILEIMSRLFTFNFSSPSPLLSLLTLLPVSHFSPPLLSVTPVSFFLNLYRLYPLSALPLFPSLGDELNM